MHAKKTNMQGQVIWITGLSGAGKSTVAKALMPHFAHAILLDGDALRQVLGVTHKAYDTQSRQELAFTYARMAKMLASQGHTVIVATISLYHAVHAWNKEHQPRYTEVFLDINENIRRQRDPKGLYAAEQKGNLSPMAGLQTTVEFPLTPHVLLNADHSIQDSVQAILQHLQEKACTPH